MEKIKVTREEHYRQTLDVIRDVAVDYDGMRTVRGLKSLITDLRMMAASSLGGRPIMQVYSKKKRKMVPAYEIVDTYRDVRILNYLLEKSQITGSGYRYRKGKRKVPHVSFTIDVRVLGKKLSGITSNKITRELVEWAMRVQCCDGKDPMCVSHFQGNDPVGKP